MDEGLVAEPCLVGIESILLVLPVKGYQTLVVLTCFAAFVTGIRGKVEHIPHMGRPQILPGSNLTN